MAWTLAVVVAAALLPATPAHAQGRRGGGGYNHGFTGSMAQHSNWSGYQGAWVVMPDYLWGWSNYPYNGVAYSPFGPVQYVRFGYGWTLPVDFTEW